MSIDHLSYSHPRTSSAGCLDCQAMSRQSRHAMWVWGLAGAVLGLVGAVVLTLTGGTP